MKKNPDGNPSGYGFCEYRDTQTVETAIKKFQNYNFYGRQLKLGYSNQAKMVKHDENQSEKTIKYSEDSLDEILATFPKRELWTFVSQMKNFYNNNSDKAKIVLQNYPQLVKALLFIQVKLDMADNNNNIKNKRKNDNTYNTNKIRRNNGMNDIYSIPYNIPPPPPPYYNQQNYYYPPPMMQMDIPIIPPPPPPQNINRRDNYPY